MKVQVIKEKLNKHHRLRNAPARLHKRIQNRMAHFCKLMFQQMEFQLKSNRLSFDQRLFIELNLMSKRKTEPQSNTKFKKQSRFQNIIHKDQFLLQWFHQQKLKVIRISLLYPKEFLFSRRRYFKSLQKMLLIAGNLQGTVAFSLNKNDFPWFKQISLDISLQYSVLISKLSQSFLKKNLRKILRNLGRW